MIKAIRKTGKKVYLDGSAPPPAAEPSPGILPYATLAADPTTGAVVSWIDERAEANGESQVLKVGGSTYPGIAAEMMGSGAYRYTVVLTGLAPDTAYAATIEGTGFANPVAFRTFATTLGAGTLKIVVVSDMHISSNRLPHSDGASMQALADDLPDLLLIAGDVVTNSDLWPTDPTRTGHWRRYFRDYIARVTATKGWLVPIFYAVGNHDVQNDAWVGTESVDPTLGFSQFLFENPKNLAPVGQNYGAVTIGDYLQVLALDTHSAYPADVGAWLASALDPAVALALPFHHSPMLPGGFRTANDYTLQTLLRNEWSEILAAASNVHATFSGHVHVETITKPYGVTAVDPGGSDKITLASGNYLVEQAGGIREYGNGYENTYDPISAWYLDHVSGDRHIWFSLDLTATTLTVSMKDSNGTLVTSRTHTL